MKIVLASEACPILQRSEGGSGREMLPGHVNMKVNRGDFMHALDEVKPAFGVSEEELSKCLLGGIIHFSPMIKAILDEGSLFVKQVRDTREKNKPLFSAILHGPSGAGKTALAEFKVQGDDAPHFEAVEADGAC